MFVLGIRGFDGFTILQDAQWGWTVLQITGEVATLTVDKYRLQNIYFSFFQIGSASSTTTSPDESASFLGVIAGLVVGVVAVAVLGLMLCRYCCRKEVYSTPEVDNFKEMPSLSL